MRSSASLIAALIAALALAVQPAAAVTCAKPTDWPCSVCDASKLTSTQLTECNTCIADLKPGKEGDAWSCEACVNAKEKSGCFKCAKNVPIEKFWVCQSCSTISADNTIAQQQSNDCYTCAQSSVISPLTGWYCQRLTQTQGCFGTTADANTASTGCLGCMITNGGGLVDACLGCANNAKFPTTAEKQACSACVTALKSTSYAYSCPTTPKFYQCVKDYGSDYLNQCNQCIYATTSSATQQQFNDCAYCLKAGKPAGCTVTDVVWALRSQSVQVPSSNPKVGSLLRFKWSGEVNQGVLSYIPHNVYEVLTLKDATAGLGPADCVNTASAGTDAATYKLIAAQKAASADVPTIYSPPVALNVAGNRYFICTVGSTPHCNPTTSGTFPMRITVEVVS